MVQHILLIKYKIQSHTKEIRVSQFTTCLHNKLIFINTGECGTIYPKYDPFTVYEVMKHIGLHISNGLVTSPKVETEYWSAKDNPVNGTDFLNKYFRVNGELWHLEFKYVFCSCISRIINIICKYSSLLEVRDIIPTWKICFQIMVFG